MENLILLKFSILQPIMVFIFNQITDPTDPEYVDLLTLPKVGVPNGNARFV